jgi:hypothetical protein
MAASTQISESAPEVNAQSASGASPAEHDLWIFRDGKRAVSGPDLVNDLRRRVAACAHDRSAVLDALIEAGELEAGLADAGYARATTAARITDSLASSLCSGDPSAAAGVPALLDSLDTPATLNISPPEGFTYYALHPSDFANVSSRMPDDARQYAVIGIRSIGATLSAVVLAALLAAGRPATRITVRPEGHPYSRRTEFSPDQLQWVQLNIAAQFLVVDEGPGRSGSTFLSVAEALLRAGVPRENITLLGSRNPDVTSLCAHNAAARWQEFRFIATSPSVNGRFEGWTYVGGGHWRQLLLHQSEPWPESWAQMERLKFISPDGQMLHKFEGMGPMGAEARERAFALAGAGFGPAVSDAGDGFLAYKLLRGRHLHPQDISTTWLDHMADYCAFRYASFAVHQTESTQLRDMLTFNVSQEFGIAISLPDEAFCTARSVIVDGRMQPHEWISTGSDRFVKTDGVDHGDNHFFPGPCDTAWDLAGIAVEWDLENDALEYVTERFRRLSGVDVSAGTGLSLYRLAYCVFRLGSCKMAVSTVKGSPEERRLVSGYNHYRAMAHSLLRTKASSLSGRAA